MSARIRPTSLRCEYRQNPLGVEANAPRFSWTLESGDPEIHDLRQGGYQILVSTSQKNLDENRGDLFDSGKVESGDSFQVRYGGAGLASAQRAWWKVRVWDGNQPSEWSEAATFTMGLLAESDWVAEWIGADPARFGSSALPMFRKSFVAAKGVRRAMVFVCGLGQFELHLNGNVVGENVLDPGWTNYAKTCLYVAHDVTALLRDGENVLGVMLGNGMYNVIGTPGRYKKFKATFGQPKMILHLRVDYEDGTCETIGSDATWKVSAGPITFSCIYGGEDYDGRLEQRGWDLPGFDEARWGSASVTSGPGGKLVAQSAPPIRVCQIFEPIGNTSIGPEVVVFDLGRNFSGWAEIVAQGEAGDEVKLLPGELLDAEGRVSQKSSGSPVFYSYTLGESRQTWRPRFSYTGFRYVEARGNPGIVKSLRGQFIHSSAEVVGRFRCSSPLFNSIHELINAAILSNMQSVLTDCPHREKLGWLEQSHLMGPAILLNYDVPLLYAKICSDMRDAQAADGCVPTLAPEYTKFTGKWADFSNSPEWGSAAVLNPWLVYQQYGDLEILRENYRMMGRYVEYLRGREQNGIIDFGLGDWYDLGPGDPGYSKLTSKALTATAIYFLDLKIAQRTARVLGFGEDAEKYESWMGRVRRAFNEKFFDAATGRYDTASQTAQAMPLALGLVESGHRGAVLERLVADIRGRGDHITAGDVGFRFVVEALAEAGRSDVIADLLSRSDAPSYGDQLRKGATALTEAWDANPEKSQNHLMLGHAEMWFYQNLAGIRVDMSSERPGQIVIQPTPVSQISWAEAECQSVYGKIKCRWRREEGRMSLSVEIPANAAAVVRLPTRHAAKEIEIGSGSYSFETEIGAL